MQRLVIIIFGIALAAGVFAETISIHVAESPSSPGGEATETIVSGCMDCFFDAGYISTNARVLPIDHAEWQYSQMDLMEARDLFIEYLIYLYLDYSSLTKDLQLSKLPQVEYKIVNVANGKLDGDGKLLDSALLGESDGDSEHKLHSLGESIAEMAKAIIVGSRNNGSGGKR